MKTRTPTRAVHTWLFNPFYYVAGAKALVVGVLVIFAAGYIGSLSKSHFDGVLDFHTGAPAPLWAFLVQGFVNWLVMGVLLFCGGKLISRSRMRIVDVFGTQALARFPTLLLVLMALLPVYQRQTERLISLTEISPAQLPPADLIAFSLVAGVFAICVVAWMLVLMYRAYAVSCNVGGSKAIALFLVAVILGEVLSKIILIATLGRVVG